MACLISESNRRVRGNRGAHPFRCSAVVKSRPFILREKWFEFWGAASA